MNYRIILLTITALVWFLPGTSAYPGSHQPAGNDARHKWVDSVYNQLTTEERIGQLFMVPAYSREKLYNKNAIEGFINARQIGGLIFMKGTAAQEALLTNAYQKLSKVPLLIGMDAEWGVAMRLDSVKDMPRAMMLGAAHDSALVYKVGAAIAAQCKHLGIQMDFAPDVDINSNAANPIISGRSFGADRDWVTRLSLAYMHGLQDNGIMACAKHFPGHGDTKMDSHHGLPQVNKTLGQLDSLELYPFKELINNGLQAVMTGHLSIPALDTEQHIASTLSRNMITGLLKDTMGFKGLVLTDALSMESLSRYFRPGDVELRAFMAGNDLLLFPESIPLAINKIKEAITTGKVPETYLEEKVKKILAVKYDAGLAHWVPVDTANIIQDLNKEVTAIREAAARESITITKDDGLIGTIKPGMRVGYISVHTKDTTHLYQELHTQLPALSAAWLPKGSASDQVSSLLNTVNNNDITIVAVHNIDFYPAFNYGMDMQELHKTHRKVGFFMPGRQ